MLLVHTDETMARVKLFMRSLLHRNADSNVEQLRRDETAAFDTSKCDRNFKQLPWGLALIELFFLPVKKEMTLRDLVTDSSRKKRLVIQLYPDNPLGNYISRYVYSYHLSLNPSLRSSFSPSRPCKMVVLGQNDRVQP